MLGEAERDERIMALLESALDRSAADREGFLRSACRDDSALYDHVRSLLQWEQRMGDFLLEPILSAPAAAADRPFEPGELVASRFRILRQIGKGGMGIVYEASDEKLERRIAIKCARAGHGNRLPPEARAAREVSHFNVCKVHELHSAETPLGDLEFLAMEFVDGETLAARLRSPTPLEINEVCEIVLQLAAGLAQAHRQGVIHGDLKPANLILSHGKDGRLRVVITDFGLAKLHEADEPGSGASERGGTFGYMAPELLTGGRATVASDIYAVGVIIHEMLGTTAARRSKVLSAALGPNQTTATIEARVSDAPRLNVHDLPSPWAAIVKRSLAEAPGDRFASVDELAEQLTGRHRIAKWIGAGVIAVLAIAALAIWEWTRPTGPPVRLALLPPVVTGLAVPSLAGTMADVAGRLAGLRRGFAVLPPSDAIQYNADAPAKAANVLGATHALRTQVEHRGNRLIVHATLSDTGTGERIRQLDGSYSDTDPGMLAKALVATVTRGLDLPAPQASTTVVPAAYPDYVQGVALLQRDYDSAEQAIPFFERAAQTDPKSVLPLAGMAEAQLLKYSRSQDRSWLDKARQSAAAARSVNPDSPAVLVIDGELENEVGQFDHAEQDFLRAAKIGPNNADIWDNLAKTYERMNRPVDALNMFRRALEAQPDDFHIYLDLFRFHWNRGEYPQAETVIRKLTRFAPGLYAAHTDLGLILLDQGRIADAESELRMSLRQRDTPTATYLLGVVSYYQRRFEDAAAQFQKVLTMRKAMVTDYLQLGSCYVYLHRLPDARGALQKAIEVGEADLAKNPRDARTRADLGVVAARLDDGRRAEFETAQALQMAPEMDLVIGDAALTYELLGNRDQAIAVLRNAPAPLLKKLMIVPGFDNLQRDARFIELLANNPKH